MKLQFRFHPLAAVAALLLLSVSMSLAQGNQFSVLGAIQGHATGTVAFPILQAAGGGKGMMSHFGSFTYTLQSAVDLPTGKGTGLFVLAFSNGDVIYGKFAGQGDTPPPPPPAPGHITESLTIDGGTGRFQGATGNLTFQRLVDPYFDDPTKPPAFDSHSGTVTGTISIPGK
jgi:hypothetical protein